MFRTVKYASTLNLGYTQSQNNTNLINVRLHQIFFFLKAHFCLAKKLLNLY